MSAFFKLLLIFSFASYFGRSFAILKNVTYDNTDPSVTYLPSGGLGWSLDLQEGLDYGGTHALADDVPNASATFKFTGISPQPPSLPISISQKILSYQGLRYIIFHHFGRTTYLLFSPSMVERTSQYPYLIKPLQSLVAAPPLRLPQRDMGSLGCLMTLIHCLCSRYKYPI